MKKLFLVVGFVIVLAGCEHKEEEDKKVNEVYSNNEVMKKEKNKYETGQVWTYKTRENESDSKIYIVKIEEFGKDEFIYHIYVDNLKIENAQLGKQQTFLGHSPVSKVSLDLSVLEMVEKTKSLPDINEGYNSWKDNNGGVFDISIKEIIEFVESMVNKAE
ncbi:MAG: hypothetical protein KAT32_00430 [Candidatus Moranbacteria bacterium]|nr:hypothetical protein [Candidatus Moranbacteria bacterium]